MRKLAHWRGFTQMEASEDLQIAQAEGCYLTTIDGRRLFDGVSSMWCNVHGHRHPRLDQAIRSQLDRVSHVTTLGMSADVTDELAERLARIAPGDLSHVFFSSDGSSAVEAALKMALQYWQQTDRVSTSNSKYKTRYLALSSAYHGDTTGAVSLGGIKAFHELFAPIIFSVVRGPLPCTYRMPEGISAGNACEYYTDQLRSLFERHHHELAAIVVEPLVQGAAGMITHPVGLLLQIRKLCDEFDVLLIADEVATGFGRTGQMFASEHESVVPDILCLGKGLTGGYLPMAATIARPHVFEAFLGTASEHRQFYHGHTFGGNALDAAVSLASLDLFDETGLVDEAEKKAIRLRNLLQEKLSAHQHVGDIRGRGMMIGIEMVKDRESKSAFDAALLLGKRICDRTTDLGVWLRPLGDVLVVLPPLVATDEDLIMVAATLDQAIDDCTRLK